MSWKGFQKAVSRAATTVLISSGFAEKTVDKDFDENERQFKLFEAKIEKLHKEAKGYLDSVRAMTLAQQRVAETVDSFYEDGTKLGYAAIQYKDAVDKLDEEARNELDECFRTTVLDPIGKLAATFPEFNEAVKKRHKKLLDYDRTRASVKRLVDKPSSDATSLPRAEQEAQQSREIYESINNTVLTEVPKLIELRVPYLDPCFESLVKSQLIFNHKAHQKFEGVKNNFGNEGNLGSFDEQAQDVLAQIRLLTICST